MQLKYIKEDKCPICGCELIVSESVEADSNELKYKEHCNGGRWEHRIFACGQKISYWPNFNKIEISEGYKCTKNEAYKLQQQKREKFIKLVSNFILNNGDVDETFQKRILERVDIPI